MRAPPGGLPAAGLPLLLWLHCGPWKERSSSMTWHSFQRQQLLLGLLHVTHSPAIRAGSAGARARTGGGGVGGLLFLDFAAAGDTASVACLLPPLPLPLLSAGPLPASLRVLDVNDNLIAGSVPEVPGQRAQSPACCNAPAAQTAPACPDAHQAATGAEAAHGLAQHLLALPQCDSLAARPEPPPPLPRPRAALPAPAAGSALRTVILAGNQLGGTLPASLATNAPQLFVLVSCGEGWAGMWGRAEGLGGLWWRRWRLGVAGGAAAGPQAGGHRRQGCPALGPQMPWDPLGPIEGVLTRRATNSTM